MKSHALYKEVLQRSEHIQNVFKEDCMSLRFSCPVPCSDNCQFIDTWIFWGSLRSVFTGSVNENECLISRWCNWILLNEEMWCHAYVHIPLDKNLRT